MKILKLYEYVKNPYFNTELRKKKGYKPKIKTGMIAVRFLSPNNVGHVNPETGEITVDYRNNKDFLKYIENKYNITYVNKKPFNNSDNYYQYFSCKPGEEYEKIEELSKNKYVTDIDFVDMRLLIDIPKLEDAYDILGNIIEMFSEESDEETNNKIKEVIKILNEIKTG